MAKKKTTKKTAKKKTAKAKAATTSRKVTLPKPRNGVQYTQSEFFECLREFCGLESRKQAKEIYNNFAEMIQQALKKGYRVPLAGLGKIQVRKYKARMGRNPATGETIRIPAKKRIRFTPAKVLKEAVL